MTAPVTGCPNCGELKLYMEYDAANRCQVMCHECGVAGPWAQGSDEAGADAWTAFWKRFPSLSPSALGVVVPAHGYEIVDGDRYDCTWAVLKHGRLDAKCSSHRDALALIESRIAEDKARSRLAAPAGDGWRDIASAPRDGTGIWGGWFKGAHNDDQPWRHQGVTFWRDGEWVNPENDEMSFDEPTHWHPLLAPPSVAKGENHE